MVTGQGAICFHISLGWGVLFPIFINLNHLPKIPFLLIFSCKVMYLKKNFYHRALCTYINNYKPLSALPFEVGNHLDIDYISTLHVHEHAYIVLLQQMKQPTGTKGVTYRKQVRGEASIQVQLFCSSYHICKYLLVFLPIL